MPAIALTVTAPVKVFAPVKIQAPPPSRLTPRVPPLSANTLVTLFSPVFVPRRYRTLAPAAILFWTLVRTNGPEPSECISVPLVVPVVWSSWISRSEVSPEPTYCKIPLVVPALPSRSAPVLVFALVLMPTLVPTPVLALLPSVLTVRVPAMTLVDPA